MSVMSGEVLLSGSGGDWFVNDHLEGWLNYLGLYNPFGYHGIIFGDDHLVNGSSHKIAVVEYDGNDLDDFYLYNKVLAEELIIYLPQYTKVRGSLHLDHAARIRLVAPQGISLSGVDFNGLEVIVSTHDLEELEQILNNKDELRAKSVSKVEIAEVKGHGLWIEACAAVVGGNNRISDFRAALYCSKPIDDYSFKSLQGSVLSSSAVVVEDDGNSLGVKLEGNIAAPLIKVKSKEAFWLEGSITASEVEVVGSSVSLVGFGSIKLASYRNQDGMVGAPGSLNIYGDHGVFAPNSRIYYALYEIIEYIGECKGSDVKQKNNIDLKNYSCIEQVCLNNEISWLFGDERAASLGNAREGNLENKDRVIVDGISSLPLIKLLFKNSLELGGRVEGESGVGIVGQLLLKLEEGARVSSKQGAIKLIGSDSKFGGEVTGDYVNINADNVEFLGEIKASNLNILAMNLKNGKSVKADELCLTLGGKLENDIGVRIEFKVGSITAEELINRGIIKSDYGVFKFVGRFENEGEISNVSEDSEASLEFWSEEGSLVSRGRIKSNYYVKFISEKGEMVVDNIVVEHGNIYLFGKKVVSGELVAAGVEVKSKDWQAKDVKSKVINFTNENQDEKVLFSGKTEVEKLFVTANELSFSEESSIAIGNIILTLTGLLENNSKNPSNYVGVWVQKGGHIFNHGYLKIGDSLDMESNTGSFSNYGIVEVKNIASIKAKDFDMGEKLSGNYQQIMDNNYQLTMGNGVIKIEERFANYGKIVATNDLEIGAGSDLTSYKHIESKEGNLYLKSGGNVYSFDGVVNPYSEILAPKGRISIAADGRVHIYIMKAKNIYLSSKIEYTHAVLLQTEEDFELRAPYYFNPCGGKIEVGGMWHLIDEDPIGVRDMGAKQLSFHQLNNEWSVGRGLHFVGKDWVQHSDFELGSDLILELSGNFINYQKLIIHGKLEIKANDLVLNEGYIHTDGSIVVEAIRFGNKKIWDSVPSYKTYEFDSIASFSEIRGEMAKHRGATLENILDYWQAHDANEFSIDIDIDTNKGQMHGRGITIITSYVIHNVEGALLHSYEGMKLQAGGEVINYYHKQKNGKSIYGDGYDIMPSYIIADNGDIEIYSNDRIYSGASDIIVKNGYKLKEHARLNIGHAAETGVYMLRGISLPGCRDPHGSDGLSKHCYAETNGLYYYLTMHPYHFSRAANVYASGGFHAYSEEGAVSAIGAQILSHGEVVLAGKDIIQKPALVGNHYIGGITVGQTVSYDAKNDLILSGAVMTQGNMYLKVGSEAHIESLQHVYLQNYIWTKKYKEVIYNIVVSEVQLVAGGGIEISCGKICHLKGAKLYAQDDISISGEKVVAEVAHTKVENMIEIKKKRGFLGSKSIATAWWEDSSVVPTSIHSSHGKVTINGEEVEGKGLKIAAKEMNVKGSKKLDLSEFIYQEKMEIKTKSRGIGAPKIDKALFASKMGKSYIPISAPARISLSSWFIDSVKGAKAETITDLEGPLGLATDVLRAGQIYNKLRADNVSPSASLAQTMLAMLPSVNFNFGTIKTSVTLEERKAVLTELYAEKVEVESGGDSSFSGTQITAEKEANVHVKGNAKMEAAVESRTQEGETTSQGPVASANFNGLTVAFSHSESDYTAFGSHHVPSFIKAPQVMVEVGGDLTIKGAYIKGQKVEVAVAKKLLIESVHDINSMEADSSSISLGVSFTPAGVAPAVSFGAGESHSNSELVNFISGISGEDVSVTANKIHLVGAEIYGTEKLKVVGDVSSEDIAETRESSSYHFGFSFDPTKATGGSALTSVNFGVNNHHDNGVVHSGLGEAAKHEGTDKGGFTASFQWNTVLSEAATKIKDWFTSPKPANDHKPKVAPEWINPDEINGNSEDQENADEDNISKNNKETKKPQPKVVKKEEQVARKTAPKPQPKVVKKEEQVARKTAPENAISDYEKINNEVDKLDISDKHKKELKQAIHGVVDELYKSSPAERERIIADLSAGKYTAKETVQLKSEGKGWLSTLWSETFGSKELEAHTAIAIAAVETCLVNPACSALLVGAATAVYAKIVDALNKGIILSTPIHENKGSVLDTPAHKEEGKILHTPFPSQEGADILHTPLPTSKQSADQGFEIPDSDVDMTILFKNTFDPEKVQYEDAPYHHQNSQGIKNPAPTNPLPTLKNSVKISDNSDRRVGVDVEHKEFVIFDKTRNLPDGDSVYHGHVRSWSGLEQSQKNALFEAEMTDLKGKVNPKYRAQYE
ncbi:hypothetical protein NOVO_09090 [Rickettsiales bacterium Ac37b]|nr:hypothetical protein NOVO_09090 [Rickettsiales bacterium Ac37b]